jgi:Gpi18-like mannosyltransferase
VARPPSATVTIALLLGYPSSAFLWQFLTEGLFISFSAGALLAQHNRRPVCAGVLAAFATATRPPGIFVVVALVAGELQRTRRLTRMCWWYTLGALGLVPVVIAQQVQAGDGFAFLHAEHAWYRGLSLPWTAVSRSVGIMARTGNTAFGSPLDLLMAAVFLGATKSGPR